MSCNKEHNPLKDERFQNVVEAFPFDRGTENEFSDLMDTNGQETVLAQNDLIHQSKKMFKHNDFIVPRSVLILILIMGSYLAHAYIYLYQSKVSTMIIDEMCQFWLKFSFFFVLYLNEQLVVQ